MMVMILTMMVMILTMMMMMMMMVVAFDGFLVMPYVFFPYISRCVSSLRVRVFSTEGSARFVRFVGLCITFRSALLCWEVPKSKYAFTSLGDRNKSSAV